MLLLVVLGVGVGSAHPFHVSIAEIEFNGESRTLEVALRVHPEDLVRALESRKRPGEKIELETGSLVEGKIAGYLAEVFVVKHGDRSLPLARVGEEIGVDWAWLYFEVDLATLSSKGSGEVALDVYNSAFFEFTKDQVNTLNLVGDGEERFSISGVELTRTVRLTKERPRARLEIPRDSLRSSAPKKVRRTTGPTGWGAVGEELYFRVVPVAIGIALLLFVFSTL